MNLVDALKAAHSTNKAIRLPIWAPHIVLVEGVDGFLHRCQFEGGVPRLERGTRLSVREMTSKHWELDKQSRRYQVEATSV